MHCIFLRCQYFFVHLYSLIMKRITIIFFTLAYLISTSGVAWSNFYCCGKLKHTYFLSSGDLTKGCKGSKSPGCCNTKTVSFKVKDDHSPSVGSKINTPDAVKLFHPAFIDLLVSPKVISQTAFSASIHSPPLISKPLIYLAVCNFRI